MPRQPVTVKGVPIPVGPFAVAVEGTPSMLISGQIAQDPVTGKLVTDDAATQARQVFTNIMTILASVGKTEADVLRVGLYLADMADFAAVNAAYGEFFTHPYPVRTAIGVAGLPLGARVEADVIIG
jgi:2-iminobutanoate/2-iminopropanoate deaminase